MKRTFVGTIEADVDEHGRITATDVTFREGGLSLLDNSVGLLTVEKIHGHVHQIRNREGELVRR